MPAGAEPKKLENQRTLPEDAQEQPGGSATAAPRTPAARQTPTSPPPTDSASPLALEGAQLAPTQVWLPGADVPVPVQVPAAWAPPMVEAATQGLLRVGHNKICIKTRENREESHPEEEVTPWTPTGEPPDDPVPPPEAAARGAQEGPGLLEQQLQQIQQQQQQQQQAQDPPGSGSARARTIQRGNSEPEAEADLPLESRAASRRLGRAIVSAASAIAMSVAQRLITNTIIG